MELDELLLRLEKIAEHRPLSKPAPGELRAVFSAIQNLLVFFPKSTHLASPASEVLKPLIVRFGDPAYNPDQRTEAMLEAAIKASLAGERDHWRKCLTEKKTAWARFGVKKDKCGDKPWSDVRNEAVHELARLLVSASEQLDRAAMPIDPHLEGATEIPKESSLVNIKVERSINMEDSKTKRQYAVDITGNTDDWYLAVLRAKDGYHPVPEATVTITSESTIYHINTEDSEVGLYITPADQIRDFESFITWSYKMPSDQLVREICRIAIQFCNEYFPDPESLRGLVSAVLREAWTERALADGTRIDIYIDPNCGVGIVLSPEEMTAYAQNHGVDLSQMSVRRFLALYKDYATYLEPDILVGKAFPGMIARWLQDRHGSHDANEFFEPGNWLVGPG